MIKEENCHMFRTEKEPKDSSQKSAAKTCLIHPSASPKLHALSTQERELIFNITGGFDGCFLALQIYHEFTELCPPSQKLSIQLGKEGPAFMKMSSCQHLNYQIFGPKALSVSIVSEPPELPHGYSFGASGDRDGRNHAVLEFSHPDPTKECFVVDMTSLQYGEAARGLMGELYFIGTMNNWGKMMKKHCGNMILHSVRGEAIQDFGFLQISKECAGKAWNKWHNRERGSWCEYCGVPGNDVALQQCTTCKVVKYCSKEHQTAGWRLHKITCKKKTSETNKEPEGRQSEL